MKYYLRKIPQAPTIPTLQFQRPGLKNYHKGIFKNLSEDLQ